MDDILSVALGKSGLDLSYLEDQKPQTLRSDNNPQHLAYDFVTTTVKPEHSNSRQSSIDDEEDVTDFLNLLTEQTENKFVQQNPPANKELYSHSSGDNVLDFLLNYNSGDEEKSNCSYSETVNSYPVSSTTSQLLPGFSIFSQLPSLNSSKDSFIHSSNNLGNNLGKNMLHSNINAVNTNYFKNFESPQRKPNQSLQQNSTSTTTAVKFKQVRNYNKLPTNAVGSFDKNKDNTDIDTIEKQKSSLQQVLMSPNLSWREKRNLMKSAMKFDMNTTLSQTPKSNKSDLLSLLKTSQSSMAFKTEDYDEDDDNEMQHSETFAEYWPMKVKVGLKHPDPVVETSSMASVQPPDVWYSLQLPSEVINERKLSALQLESIIYASQQHEKLMPNGKRAGFLIGDGAGVGKGRTIAGVIFENYLHGRKRAVWLSVSNDLKYDAIRDLKDVGYHAKVQALNKFKYDEKLSASSSGKFKKGVIFATYSSLIGETSSANVRFKSRLQQLMQWCGKDFDGVIVFDECHKAKNLMPTGSSKPTKTGITVLKLQDLLPKARVIYCSATGASEPKNMAYMNRLGLWGAGTAFKEFTDFISSVEKRGVGAMEMVAMDMKLRGMYIARQLSFSGVTFDIKQVKLCQTFIEMYDAAVKLWLDAREKFEKAADLVGLDGKGKKTMWGQFWSAHQRFFKYLCIAAKVKKAVEIAKEAVDLGKCVIFGLQSTGEARTLDQIDDLQGELNDFISTTKGVFSTLVEKHFPVTQNPNAISHNTLLENRKRKRAWRKNMGVYGEKKKKLIDGVEYMSSSDESSGVEKETSGNTTIDLIASDHESETDGEDEDKNPFADSSSNSEDEDSWLKKSSPEKKSKTKIKNNQSTDASMDALAAAGFNLNRQFSWANSPTPSVAGSSLNMKSKTTKKSNTPSGLSDEMFVIKNNFKRTTSNVDNITHCKNLKQSLLEQLEVISPYLPPNTLDELIDELGGPSQVAEMTGRKGRIVAKWDDTFAYEARSKDDVQLEVLNVVEKQRFMDGTKLVAVISEAASSGISLQADRRAKNQRRRVHITLELPWSADKAIQQFGRSHRSNQVSAPEYLFLISELAGEQRFASIVAKRLESLGALTHGDRRATESRDLSRFNFDTKYGRQALDVVLKSILGNEKPIASTPANYVGSFIEDVKDGLIGIGLIQKDINTGCLTIPDKDYTNISRFMNRILGLTVSLQNALFQYFNDTLTEIIKEAKRNGRWDEGIVDLGSEGESVQQIESKVFICPSTSGQVTTELVTVNVERGLSYPKACSMLENSINQNEGFYETIQLRNGKKTAVLILKDRSSKNHLYTIYRPNIGMSTKQETLEDISNKFEMVSIIDAKITWEDQYQYSEENCVHAFWRGYCKKRIAGLPCEIGARKRKCYILCGSVLSVWSKVETLLSCQPGAASKMQIIRAKLDNGKKLVGMLIPSNCVDVLKNVLSNDSSIIQQID